MPSSVWMCTQRILGNSSRPMVSTAVIFILWLFLPGVMLILAGRVKNAHRRGRGGKTRRVGTFVTLKAAIECNLGKDLPPFAQVLPRSWFSFAPSASFAVTTVLG